MTIRQGILLLGAIATICLAYLLGGTGLRKMSVYRMQQAMAAEMHLKTSLSAIVHELQQERDMSSGYPGVDSPEHAVLMRDQRLRTDETLERHPLSGKGIEQLQIDLLTIRSQVDADWLSWDISHTLYSSLIAGILRGLTEIDKNCAVFAEDLQAFAHLIMAKEYLGQIRSAVNRSLQELGGLDLETSYAVANFETSRRVRLEMFSLLASNKFLSELDQAMSPARVRDSMDLIVLVGSFLYKDAMVDLKTWYHDAGLPIDGLRQVEQAMLSFFTTEMEGRVNTVRTELIRNALGIFGIGGLVLILVVYSMRNVLRTLDMLTGHINSIIASRDFSRRIPSQPRGEIRVIVNGFNGLLNAAERLLKEKERLAYTDGLTGLHNRMYFNEVAHSSLDRKKRHPGSLALIMLDIDHFKQINDTFGHDVGDLVLRELGRRLQGAIRSTDVFARWGGEEFVVLLPDDGLESAHVLAEKLRRLVEAQPFSVAGHLTVSVGVAGLMPGEGFDSLCKRVDQALYESKCQGRNKVTAAS